MGFRDYRDFRELLEPQLYVPEGFLDPPSVPGDAESEVSLSIKDVKFSGPATIVFWDDGDKTVVKCQDGDVYDKEKGLLMAIAKRVYGYRAVELVGRYCDEL